MPCVSAFDVCSNDNGDRSERIRDKPNRNEPNALNRCAGKITVLLQSKRALSSAYPLGHPRLKIQDLIVRAAESYLIRHPV